MAEGGIMNNGNGPEPLKITRKSLIDTGSVLISGCAIRLSVAVVGCSKAKVSAGLEYLQAHRQEIDIKAQDALNEAFRGKISRKSKNYVLGPINFADDRMRITVYGHDKETGRVASTAESAGLAKPIDSSSLCRSMCRPFFSKPRAGKPA